MNAIKNIEKVEVLPKESTCEYKEVNNETSLQKKQKTSKVEVVSTIAWDFFANVLP